MVAEISASRVTVQPTIWRTWSSNSRQRFSATSAEENSDVGASVGGLALFAIFWVFWPLAPQVYRPAFLAVALPKLYPFAPW